MQESKVRREIEVVGGGAHRGGRDFVEADFAYGFQTKHGIERDKVFVVLGEVEFVWISESKSMPWECRLEAWEQNDWQGIKWEVGITEDMNEHKQKAIPLILYGIQVYSGA